MLYNYNRYRLLKVFLDNPTSETGFQLRELSRKISLAPKSVSIYLEELIQKGLVIKKIIRKYPVYFADRDSSIFKTFKKIDILFSLKESGLIDFLEKQCMPDAIILFGSTSLGEDVEESDIDMFLQCNQKQLELIKFEKKLNKSINIIFRSDFSKLSNELKNNILNGIVLSGYLEVF